MEEKARTSVKSTNDKIFTIISAGKLSKLFLLFSIISSVAEFSDEVKKGGNLYAIIFKS